MSNVNEQTIDQVNESDEVLLTEGYVFTTEQGEEMVKAFSLNMYGDSIPYTVVKFKTHAPRVWIKSAGSPRPLYVKHPGRSTVDDGFEYGFFMQEGDHLLVKETTNSWPTYVFSKGRLLQNGFTSNDSGWRQISAYRYKTFSQLHLEFTLATLLGADNLIHTKLPLVTSLSKIAILTGNLFNTPDIPETHLKPITWSTQTFGGVVYYVTKDEVRPLTTSFILKHLVEAKWVPGVGYDIEPGYIVLCSESNYSYVNVIPVNVYSLSMVEKLVIDLRADKPRILDGLSNPSKSFTHLMLSPLVIPHFAKIYDRYLKSLEQDNG